MDVRKRFRIRNTMMSDIIYFQHNACAVMKLWYFYRFSVFEWTGDYDSNMLRVVAYLFENGGKHLRKKNIRIHVDGAKPIAFLPLSSLLRLPNYCLTNLLTSMLISRFLVSSLFSFFLYFRKRVLLMIGFTILILSLLVCFLLCHCN